MSENKDGISNQLTNIRAKELIKLEKHLKDDKTSYDAPYFGESIRIQFEANKPCEYSFLLTLREGNRVSSMELELRKFTMGTLASIYMLIRVDIGPDSLRHINPDGELILGSHVHLYDEKYGDKYAFRLTDKNGFYQVKESDSQDISLIFDKFSQYCNLDDNLIINWRLGV